MADVLSTAFRATGVQERSQTAELESTRARVVRAPDLFTEQTPDVELVRSAELLEVQASTVSGDLSESLYSSAFSCWVELNLRGSRLGIPSTSRLLSDDLGLAFHLAATGTLSGRVTEVRQALTKAYRPAEQVPPRSEHRDQAWGQAVLHDTVLAVVLLTRKGGGWADIALALSLLDSLRERQAAVEGTFIEQSAHPEAEAVRLVASYHLAQMVTVAGRYLKTGEGAAAGVTARLATHESQAQRAIEMLRDGDLAHLARMLHAVLTALVNASIWAQVATMGDLARQFADALVNSDEPTLELWPSQVEAMSGSVLDTYQRAVIVEMPTSAGKTLLAKFAIVQAIALSRSSTVAYVVPTRVLVNQVTDELRRDFEPLGLTVEQAVPVFNLDPTESTMLSGPLNVLVTTPEKLDLLIRDKHESLDDLSMVVVDEAHNIADPSRGARLELVLATIRRDRPNARYLLLSPFVPNAKDLVEWLGDGRHREPIHVKWQPNRRVVGALHVVKRQGSGRALRRDLHFTPISAVGNQPGSESLGLGQVDSTVNSIGRIAKAGVQHLGWRGQTLIVTRGRPTAVKRALEIAADRNTRTLSEFGEAVIRHTQVELGPDNSLAQALRRGVAFHHAGLSFEMRRLIEQLMRSKDIDVVVGTTTLAQGANFPLANVVVEGRRLGRDDITHADFWNIAGRAGRGMMSDLGLIALPITDDDQRKKWAEFFTAEATQIASQLASVVTAADSIGSKIDRNAVRQNKNLSAFLQYLAHAMRVSGSFDHANQVEDLLRSSLVYRQVQRDSPSNAQALIRLCRTYLDSISGERGLVSLADGTGFSTPTIAGVRRDMSLLHPEMRDPRTWDPGAIFGADVQPLADRMALVAEFPEMELGTNDIGAFSAERVAKILQAWVNGAPVHELADEFGNPASDEITRHAQFTSYLNSRLTTLASWGLGALERVAFAGVDPDSTALDTAGHVPSMVLFGVNSPEAIWLRMTGLTREAARGASELWRSSARNEPSSFAEVREWIGSLDDAAWSDALSGTAYAPGDMRMLWPVLRT